MRTGVWAGLIGGAVLGLSVAATAAAADLAVYGKLPSVEDIALSPDGKLLATLQTDGAERKVYVRDLDANKVISGLETGTDKVRYIEWADDHDLIVVMSKTTNMLSAGIIASTSDYEFGLILDTRTQKQAPLLGTQKNSSLNVVLGAPSIRAEGGQTVLYVTGIAFNNESQGVRSVFRVPLTRNEAARMVFEGESDSEGFIVDSTGRVVVETKYADRSGRTQLLVRGASGGWKPVTLPDDYDGNLALLGYNGDGTAYLIRYRTKTDSVVAELSPDGAWTPRKDLADHGVMMDRVTERFMGTVREGADDQPDYAFASPSDAKAWKMIRAAYPGERVTLAEFSKDHKKVLVLCDSPTDGPAYALVDVAAGQARFVGSLYAGIKSADVSPMQRIAYKAADGLTIHGYLTLPRAAGKDPKGLPLVVLAHGGPASRDDSSFDWWSQALAAQGYAVLRANYRGSSGYGRDFLEAGFGQWGKKMQTDLSDGVRFLAKQGTIDPERVCIVGASYGGYAALAGATLDKGVYRCAASVAGPADLGQMLITEKQESGFTSLRYWTKFMGVNDMRDPSLAAVSPAMHAGDVAIPILLVHGKDDTVVPYQQSKIMADALKRAGKPFEFVTMDGEDHWLSSGATRYKMLEAMVVFLKKYNPPD